MSIEFVDPKTDLSEVVQVLNLSHGTVAKKFGFTKESNPSNNAFITDTELRKQLVSGINLYVINTDNRIVGCIAIEESKSKAGTYYIEKVSVLPEYRKNGFGIKLMDFACSEIKNRGGTEIGIALIDEYTELKNWYLKQKFKITGTKKFEHLPFCVCFMSKGIS